MAEDTAAATTTAVPAPAATPAAAAAPANANGVPKPKPNGGGGKPKPKNRTDTKMVSFVDKNGNEITMPESSFQARLNREAVSIVRKRLGVSLEEAERIVKSGGAVAATSTPANGNAATPAAAASNVADESIRKLQGENQRLRSRFEQAQKRADDEARKRQKEVQRLKDKQVEAELRAEASIAGIHDPDYALHLFARAAAAGKTNDPKVFFGGLKTSHGHLFREGVAAAAPEPITVDVPATTAPPESQAPGEEKPRPAAAGSGSGSPGQDAEKMSPAEFSAHQRRYGYVPGS